MTSLAISNGAGMEVAFPDRSPRPGGRFFEFRQRFATQFYSGNRSSAYRCRR
jgi:hypothetical protein